MTIPTLPAAHDWAEDFAHENGNYQNTCIKCGNTFIGHKRRVICKVCTVPMNPAIPTDAPDEAARLREDAEDPDIIIERLDTFFRRYGLKVEKIDDLTTLRDRLAQVEGALGDKNAAMDFACARREMYNSTTAAFDWLAAWWHGEPDEIKELEAWRSALTPTARDRGDG